MFLVIWTLLERLFETLGLEVAASMIATLIRHDETTVYGLLADVLLMSVLIVSAEKALELAKLDWRIKWFLIIETAIAAGLFMLIYETNGANPDVPIDYLVRRASIYYLVPWSFAFVLCPLVLVWLSLRDVFGNLGGSTISRITELTVFAIFVALLWWLRIMPPQSNEWPIWEYALFVTAEALVPTTIVMIAIAYRRRSSLRLAVAATASWGWKYRSKPRSIWKSSNQMSAAEMARIQMSFREWNGRKTR